MSLKASYALNSIGLGAMPLSITGRPDTNTAVEIIHSFLDAGGNFIDTADVYGLDEHDRGHNEKLVYDAVKSAGRLDTTLIATKGGATRPDGGWELYGGHPRLLRKVCEQSLVNLKRSEHSLYYLHGPDPDVPLEDSIGELVDLQNEGKIKHIGIANASLTEIKTAATYAKITSVQNRCNPFCKSDLHNGVVDYCRTNDMIYVPYCPLGGWLDHGKLATSDWYAKLIAKYNISSYQLSLAWLLSKGQHIIPVPGMDNLNQVQSNLDVKDAKLSDDAIQSIDEFPDLYVPCHQSPASKL